MDDNEIEATAQLIYETGLLKLSKRTGWWLCGVKDPESVAEHSFRTAIIAGLLAGMEGADPARSTFLAVWHDTGETRVGDIPHMGRRYLDAASNEKIAEDQTAGLPAVLVDQVRNLIHDYENSDSLEVDCAHDADKLDCLFQAIEYRDTGYSNVTRWIESSRQKLRTKAAERLADAAVAMSSQQWHDTIMDAVRATGPGPDVTAP
ncbi:HD domain-containing protein [Catenulispora sp. NF23]|uniref:5'-deoxynucleotidase n=1 Tax=Catenulispora pinistramenti TaxID=2705254 RepID=A0ABS5KK98_9ACTN|nr:HD domain-containing protein [Catenulispora pinistramenti]MBS2531604.1 HD domain-containing protein [Catenulispora pinistramenti]MBS2546146.1 HD domain-containing protein [Catenulispora pinistramenti]